MVLKLYSFSKKHNSTKQLASEAAPVATYNNVFLKEATDLDEPTFLIDDNFQGTCNYAYLEDLGRFYFVKGWRLSNNRIWALECECDALATYKAYILLYEAFVERTSDSRHYRLNFNDELVSVSQEVVNFDMAVEPISDFSSSNGCYVLRMAGGDADGVSTFVTDNLASLAPIFDIDNYITDTEDPWYQILGNIVFDPWDYIIAFYWSPLKLSFYTANGAYSADVWIKWYNTGIRAYKLPNNKVAFINEVVESRPAALYADFRKLNPNFTRYKLYVPAVGLLDMDNNEAQSQIRVNYTIALDTGSTSVNIIRNNDLTLIAHYNCELYVPLQGATDRVDVGQIFSGALQTSAGLISGTTSGMVAGIENLVKTVHNIITPMPQMIGGAGGVGVRADTNIYFITECYQSGELPTEVAGRPCYRNLLLSNVEGFVKCGNASLELPCNERLKNKINAMLNEGIFIE